MKLQVFTVRDAAVGSFLQPFFCRSHGEALRSFSDAVSNAEHQFAKHASDYALFFLGEFDDNSGVFDSREPERVVSANEILGPDSVTGYRSGANGSGTIQGSAVGR